MKVTLVYARIGHSTQPPMGILSIASVLERAGHDVQVEDPFERKEFLNRIVSFEPQVVGISFVSPGLHRAGEIIQLLRRELTDAVFCCGGPHATAFGEETARHLDVDFVVIGEGEYALKDVCQRLERGEDYRDLAGLAYADNGHVVRTPPRPLISDLDELPFPARHLLSFDRYLAPPGQIRGVVLDRCTTVHSRRGCPSRCTFCGAHIVHGTLNGRAVRMRSVENVLEEIQQLRQNYDVKGIWFTDDVITNDNEWMSRFCDALRRERFGILWGGHARVVDIVGRGGARDGSGDEAERMCPVGHRSGERQPKNIEVAPQGHQSGDNQKGF